MDSQLGEAVIEGIRRLQDRVSDMHDETQKQLSEVNVSLVKQEENLRLHMYRTDLAEQRLELIESDIKPLKTYVAVIKTGFMTIGAVATIVGLISGLLHIIEYIMH